MELDTDVGGDVQDGGPAPTGGGGTPRPAEPRRTAAADAHCSLPGSSSAPWAGGSAAAAGEAPPSSPGGAAAGPDDDSWADLARRGPTRSGTPAAAASPQAVVPPPLLQDAERDALLERYNELRSTRKLVQATSTPKRKLKQKQHLLETFDKELRELQLQLHLPAGPGADLR